MVVSPLYDKRDDFNFLLSIFHLLIGNIPESPAYGVFVTNWGCVRGQYHTTMNKHNPLKV